VIVFVHGVPETAELWDTLRIEIDEESVALSLPGFGKPRPDGFGASKDDYAEWLTGELDRIGSPVHLVGHDWGAGLTYRVATAYGDLVTSWAADVANILHPDYVWHQFAQIWQAPGEGEAAFEGQLAMPVEARGAGIEALGVSHQDAVAMMSRLDETMAACILSLYRSATPNPYGDWGNRFARTQAPGLVLVPTEDPFGDEKMSRDVAGMLGARVDVLKGLGHWWMLQDPSSAAAVLQRFWSSLPPH
jgi:pimeloyl-ACP methyl ester carboxylesterase